MMKRTTRLRWDDLLQLGAGLAGAAAIAKIYWLTGDGAETDSISAAIRHHGVITAVVFKLILPVAAIAGCLFFAYRALVDKPIAILATPRIQHNNGLPSISWEQIAGSTETLADSRTSGFNGALVVFVLIGGLSGYFLSQPDNALRNTLIGMATCLLLGFHALGRFASELTPNEKSSPVTRTERCRMLVEEGDGTLMFVIARGAGDSDDLPIVARLPLDSFSNFEEGTHKQWFRSRSTTAELNDWGVIVLQTRSGDVVPVAESVDAQYELTKLLGLFQMHIVEPREQLMQTFVTGRRAQEHGRMLGGSPESFPVPSRRF